MPRSDYEDSLDFLFQRINYERTDPVPYLSRHFKLNRMRRLLERLGDPHLQVPAIHIAGSKGKGSTSCMVASILQSAGYRTGLYTSPHLNRIEERIAVDGQCCSAEDFIDLVNRLRPVIDELDQDLPPEDCPTFFEVTTALAWLHFAAQKCDVCVLEVGLGGRLDSTNVCTPLVTLITSISLDHTRQLGNTLAAIAAEKAGIIKSGVPLISGVESGKAAEVIQRVAQQHSAPCLQINRDFQAVVSVRDGRTLLDYQATDLQLTQLELGLHGLHQGANAALAITAMQQLPDREFSISLENIRTGLQQARCAARIEVIANDPPLILDTAHNEASIAALLDTVDRLFPNHRQTVIFGTSRDKDADAMLKLLGDRCSTILLTEFQDNPRAFAAKKLAAILPNQRTHQLPSIQVANNPEEAWRQGQLRRAQGDALIITGSFFLAAEFRELLKQEFTPTTDS